MRKTLICGGLLLMAAALCLTLWNLHESRRAEESAREALNVLEERVGESDMASGPRGRESLSERKDYRNGISYWQAFAVGLGQALAVVPGLSRSGTTISTGLLCGVRRDVMAQFSFLMVMIPILGESFLQLVGGEMGASSVGALPLALGFVSAFISGLFACKVMIALVKKAKLSWFALYCAVVALLIFIFA